MRLRGREVTFVVTPPPVPEFKQPTTPASQPTPPMPEDDSTARVNFRPPESLKNRIEDAARAEGLSVNAWLVRTCTMALDAPAAPPPSPLTIPTRRSGTWIGDSLTGWLR